MPSCRQLLQIVAVADSGCQGRQLFKWMTPMFCWHRFLGCWRSLKHISIAGWAFVQSLTEVHRRLCEAMHWCAEVESRGPYKLSKHRVQITTAPSCCSEVGNNFILHIQRLSADNESKVCYCCTHYMPRMVLADILWTDMCSLNRHTCLKSGLLLCR